jgi:hypothetical protein
LQTDLPSAGFVAENGVRIEPVVIVHTTTTTATTTATTATLSY